MKYEPVTRKGRALARFAANHPRLDGMSLTDDFYDQACLALGICNHSSWAGIEPDDPRWDELFKDGCGDGEKKKGAGDGR